MMNDVMQEFVAEMEATMTPYEMVFNTTFVPVIPEPKTPYEMLFDQIYEDEHIPWANANESASGWWETPILWKNFHNSEEYYRHLLLVSAKNLEDLFNYMNKGKFLDFYADNTIPRHYWEVFRDLTEDETEEDYNTPHIPVIHSKHEVASGWFNYLDGWEMPREPISDMEFFRNILMRSVDPITIAHCSNQLDNL